VADHIDFVVKQWANAMPALDVSSMEVFGRMLRIMKHLAKKRAKVLSALGFHEGDFDFLANLRRAGEPYCLSPTTLYQSLLVTSGAMTNRLNRLEAQGLIVRLLDPSDKRSMRVALTETGLHLIEHALVLHVDMQNALLSTLDDAQVQQLRHSLSQLLISTEESGGTEESAQKNACTSSPLSLEG